MTQKQRYLTYRAVQATSIWLGIVVIAIWPDLREESLWRALEAIVTHTDFQPLGHILITLVAALDTPLFWGSLAVYVLAFVISLVAYARIMAYSPVMVGQMLLLTIALCLFAGLVRLNWLTAMTLLAPLLVIMTISGVLYNLLLAAARIQLERLGYYTRHSH